MKEHSSVGQVLSQAFAMFEAGHLAEARRLARMLDAKRPEPAGLAYLLGLLALADGQGRKAAQHLSRSVGQTPGAIPPLLALARSQSQQQRWTDARSLYHRLLAIAPDLAIAWQEMAGLALQAGDLAAAYPPLLKASRLTPGDAVLRNNFGISARAAGKPEQAEICFKTSILLDPGFAKSYANLAGLSRHRRLPAVADAGRALRIEDSAAAHVELGQALLDAGQTDLASAEFAIAAHLLPGQPEPLWLMAESLRKLGRNGEAAERYRQIMSIDPDDRFGAKLALAQMGDGDLPERATAAQVSALYDQYAGDFERNLLNDLTYRGPEILFDALGRAGLAGPLNIIDAGCGTGLMGQAIKPWAKRLVGVDLSEKMVEQARNRGIYDELIHGDLLSCLAAQPARFDLVIAADVLIYLGDLHAVAAAAFTALRQGGAFAFTVERGDDRPVSLLPTGRFAHSGAHLRQVAEDSGFTVALLDPTSTRYEKNLPVPGLICILRKP